MLRLHGRSGRVRGTIRSRIWCDNWPRKGFLFSDRGDAVLRGFQDPARLYEVRWRDRPQ